MGINGRLTITDVAKTIGITPRTIMRWEKAGKIKSPKRDWRGWRFYSKEDIEEIREFFESAYEYNENDRSMAGLAKIIPLLIFAIMASLIAYVACTGERAYAEPDIAHTPGVTETPTRVDIDLNALPVVKTQPAAVSAADAVKYTLGPNDVISIEVRRHPEFSGLYKINSEGNIDYKFVGDIFVNGLTKTQLKDKITGILSRFLVEPEIDVSIVEYLSKVFYVVGEVSKPGKFYMRGNTVAVREALFQAGLPTHAAAMRRCRLITPNNTGRDNYVDVNVYKLLYEGDLACNLEMKPNEVLYIPATLMAKIIRVISPVTTATSEAAGAAARGAVASGL